MIEEKYDKANPGQHMGGGGREEPTVEEFLRAARRGFSQDEREAWMDSQRCAGLLALYWEGNPPPERILKEYLAGTLAGFELGAFLSHLNTEEGKETHRRLGAMQ